MRTLIQISLAFALIATFFVGSAFTTQKDTFSTDAAATALTPSGDIRLAACVGQCGFSYSGSYIVTDPGTQNYLFEATSDLCGALGVKAFIRVNGQTVFLGNVELGATHTFSANQGDLIQLDAELFIKQRVPCNPRGQVDMVIIELN